MKKVKDHIGKKVEFTASRIINGNPVKGTVVDFDEEWITVKLAHTIEGLSNVWYEGQTRSFRKGLISGAIKGI